MKYRRLGDSDLDVSEICLGSWLTYGGAVDATQAEARLRPIAGGLGITIGQLALAWVLHEPNLSSAIVGASRPEQVVENAGASDVELDESTLAAIDEALAT